MNPEQKGLIIVVTADLIQNGHWSLIVYWLNMGDLCTPPGICFSLVSMGRMTCSENYLRC